MEIIVKKLFLAQIVLKNKKLTKDNKAKKSKYYLIRHLLKIQGLSGKIVYQETEV